MLCPVCLVLIHGKSFACQPLRCDWDRGFSSECVGWLEMRRDGCSTRWDETVPVPAHAWVPTLCAGPWCKQIRPASVTPIQFQQPRGGLRGGEQLIPALACWFSSKHALLTCVRACVSITDIPSICGAQPVVAKQTWCLSSNVHSLVCVCYGGRGGDINRQFQAKK